MSRLLFYEHKMSFACDRVSCFVEHVVDGGIPLLVFIFETKY